MPFLRPSLSGNRSPSLLSPSSPPTVPIPSPIAACGTCGHMAVRTLAAKALAPLVSLGDALPLTHALMASLPSGTPDAPPATDGRERPHWDRAHGVLLQLEQLVDSAAMAGHPSSVLALCDAVLQGMLLRTVLGSPRHVPPSVAHAFLKVRKGRGRG